MLLKFHKNCWFFKSIFCENFEIAAVQKDANLVELEKCCQTHIFLQNFVLVQPRTSPSKICKILPILITLTPNPRHRLRKTPTVDEGRGPGGEAEAHPAAGPGRRNREPTNFRQNFARFRLYRRRSLQVNRRFAAFFKNLPDYLAEFLKFGKILRILQQCRLQMFAEFQFSQKLLIFQINFC